jgi:hypothetical protein
LEKGTVLEGSRLPARTRKKLLRNGKLFLVLGVSNFPKFETLEQLIVYEIEVVAQQHKTPIVYAH